MFFYNEYTKYVPKFYFIFTRFFQFFLNFFPCFYHIFSQEFPNIFLLFIPFFSIAHISNGNNDYENNNDDGRMSEGNEESGESFLGFMNVFLCMLCMFFY